jgi:hypothetical protein
VRLRTYKKLSWMLHFLMKALWQGEIRASISGASQNARSLVMILAIVRIRLIGQKSEMSSASSFFGRTMMFASLSRFKSRHLLIKRELPSGP